MPSVIGDSTRGFALASVTKILTATTILVAVEEGTLRLDQPAGPEGSTISHLLAHASGLSPDGTVLVPPGTRRIYSNAGFDVLAEALVDASGIEFATYLQEAVLDPLGMASTTLHGSPARDATSSLEDLLSLVGLWLKPQHVISSETIADATRPHWPELSGVLPGFGQQSPNDWGLGVEIRGRKSPHWTGQQNSPSTFGHFGQSGTFCWVDPLLGSAMVGLTDHPFGPWASQAWPKLSDQVITAIVASRYRNDCETA